MQKDKPSPLQKYVQKSKLIHQAFVCVLDPGADPGRSPEPNNPGNLKSDIDVADCAAQINQRARYCCPYLDFTNDLVQEIQLWAKRDPRKADRICQLHERISYIINRSVQKATERAGRRHEKAHQLQTRAFRAERRVRAAEAGVQKAKDRVRAAKARVASLRKQAKVLLASPYEPWPDSAAERSRQWRESQWLSSPYIWRNGKPDLRLLQR